MIKALRKTSLIDYPNKIASVIFTGGCNFKCDYCYNTELVHNYNTMKTIPIDYVMEILLSRKHIINHVVITGGEPTIHLEMIDFIKQLKDNGFTIKMDSNASNNNFSKFLEFIDYVAVDYKAPFDYYKDIVNNNIDKKLLLENFEAAKSMHHEFRSVVWEKHPLLNSIDEIVDVIGISNYYVQNIKYMKNFIPIEETEINNFINQLKNKNIKVNLR